MGTSSAKEFKLRDFNSLDLISSFPLLNCKESHYLFLDNDTMILTWGNDNDTIRFRELPSGKILKECNLHKGCNHINSVKINPKNNLIASADNHSNLIIWDYLTCNCIHKFPKENFEQYGGTISELAFSPNGNYLAIGFNHPSNIIIVETNEYNIIQKYSMHTLGDQSWCIYSMIFDDDNENVYSISVDGMLHKWQLMPNNSLPKLSHNLKTNKIIEREINNDILRSIWMQYNISADPAAIGTPENESLKIKDWIEKYRYYHHWKGANMLWLVLRPVFMADKDLRLFAVWCAREALKTIDYPAEVSINACNVAEKFAKGEATEEELKVARYAATYNGPPKADFMDSDWIFAWYSARNTCDPSAESAARGASGDAAAAISRRTAIIMSKQFGGTYPITLAGRRSSKFHFWNQSNIDTRNKAFEECKEAQIDHLLTYFQ